MSKDLVIATDSVKDVFNRLASDRGLQANSIYHKEFKTYFEMAALLQTHWIFQQAVTLEAFHMVRKFRQLKVAPEGYEKIMKKLAIKKVFFNGEKLAKTYGGAIGVLVIDDGLDPSEPLQIDKIRKDGLLRIELYEKPLLSISNLDDPSELRSTKFTHYKINTKNPLTIHKSRCLYFNGDETTSSYTSSQNDFLGNSVIYKLYDVLIAETSINDIFANLPIRLNQPVLKTNLKKMNTADAQDALYNRLAALNISLSMFKTLIIDKETEELDTVQLDSASITSLDEAISAKASKVLNIPELVLLGINPSGIGATGESGLTLFYDKIEAMQGSQFDENLELLDKVASKAFFNTTSVVVYEWIPLYHRSKKADAETEQIYINNANTLSVNFSPEIILMYLQKNGVFDEEMVEKAKEDLGVGFNE
jgi:hypothetical protein